MHCARKLCASFAKNWRSLPIGCGLIVRYANETLGLMTIFEKIIARQIPAKIIWEDEEAIAFHDVDPQAPVHVLIVPKRPVPRLADASDKDAALLGKLLLVARDVAKELELSSGYRVVINCGPDAGESVPHLHVHLLGNRALAWPPG
jgi:histidine triad (HIT) family protein